MRHGDISQHALPHIAFDLDDILDPPKDWIRRLEVSLLCDWPRLYAWAAPAFFYFRKLDTDAERVIWWLVAEKEVSIAIMVRRPYSMALMPAVEKALVELPSARLHLIPQTSHVEQVNAIRLFMRQYSVHRVVLRDENILKSLPTAVARPLESWTEEVLR